MKKMCRILTEWRKRDVQRHLDESTEMTQRWADFLQVVPETPPKLEGSRILLLMVGTPSCLYAALYALYLSYQLDAELYVLHKGFLAPIVLEQATELQVSIPFARMVDSVQLDKLIKIVNEHTINLIVTSGRIPNAQRLLTHLSVPILFTRRSIIPKDDNKTHTSARKEGFD